MQRQFLPFLLAALALAKPQSIPDLSGLPQCAQSIVLAQINATPCGADIACVCRETAFIGNLRNLIVASCGEADAAAAETFHKATCAQHGVTIDATPSSTAPADGAGATVTSTTIVLRSIMSESMMSSVTGNPSVPATTDSIRPSVTLGGDEQESCTVTTTTVCQTTTVWHTATVGSMSTGMSPSSYTGAADVVGVNGVLAGLAVVAALL